MRYLVTGAQGFAGRFVCAEILRTAPAAEVVGTGRSDERYTSFTHNISWAGGRLAAPLTTELRDFDRDRYRYLPCDLNDEPAVERLGAESDPDVVIHLAAALRDDAAGVLVKSNVSGTATLVGALAKLTRKPLLIFGSSGSVYGVPEALPLHENQRCAPYEPYAMSKFAAEFVTKILAENADIPTIIARIFNIAGPGQDERHVCGRFAAQAAAIVRGDAPATLELGDLLPTRDFIDVRDVAQALAKLATRGIPGETYNVSSGRETSIGDVLKLTLKAAKLEDGVELVERYSRPADIPRAYADIGKLRRSGFAPEYPLDRTVADLLSYYLSDVAAAATGATTSAIS
jgi:nucleoside-diphosphate-sugar epimerase